MASLCLFDSPDFTKTVSNALPTYLIDPANTNTISVTGSFTNGLGTVCQFPTTKPAALGLAGGNTITPYLVGPNKATTTCGFITPPSNLLGILANGMATYTAVSCPTVAWNQMPTGTYALGFTEPAGPAFTQGQFVIAPATTFSRSVFATITSATTLSPAAASTVTSSGTTFVPLTVSLSAPASSTTTATTYSSTITSSVQSTLSAAGSVVTTTYYTETDYTTMFSSAYLSSTQVVTDTTTITQTGTSAVNGTPLTVTASVSSCPVTSSGPTSSSSSNLASTTSSSSSLGITTSTSDDLVSTTSLSTNLTSTTVNSSTVAPTTSSMTTATPGVSSASIDLITSSSPNALTQATSTTSSSTTTLSGTSSIATTSSLAPSMSINTSSSQAASVANASVSTSPIPTLSSSLTTSVLPSGVTTSAASLVPVNSPAATSSTTSPSALVSSIIACPASNGTIITSNGKQFQIECFLDRQAAQIAVKAANTFTDCTNACAVTAGCWAVSYSNKYCYMKGALSSPVFNSNVWGARVMATAPVSTTTSATVSSKSSGTSTASVPTSTVSANTAIVIPALACPLSGSTTYNTSSGSQYTIECFIDHQGGNLAMSYQPTLESCIAYCDNLPGCIDVSWVPARPGPCYAKSLLGTGTSNSNVWGARKLVAAHPSVSSTTASSAPSTTSAAATGLASLCPKGMTNATLSCPSSNSLCYTNPANDIYHIECSTDRVGGDLALAWASSLENCLETCSETPGCVDVSFVPSLTTAITPSTIQYGCYLKSSIQNAVSNSKVMGAVLVSRGNAGLPLPTFPTSFTLAKRATKVGAPDYTYPSYPTTTLTIGTSTIAQTVTPPAASTMTTTVLTTVYTSQTVTPAPSGIATTTLTIAATFFTTNYVAEQGQVSTVTVGAVSTVTAVVTQNVVVTQTSVVVQTETTIVVVMQTRSADVVTVTTTGCFA